MFRKAAAFGGTLLVLSLFVLSPAWAAQISTPDANGNYAHCNVTYVYESDDLVTRIACQYAGTATADTNTFIELTTGELQNGGTWFGTSFGTGSTTELFTGGKMRGTHVFSNWAGGTEGEPDDPWTCQIKVNGGSVNACEITRLDNFTGTPAMPFDHYSGGSDGDEDQNPTEGEDVESGCSFFDVVCWLRRLFIPEGDAISAQLDELHDAAASSWPVGPALEAGGAVTGIGDDVDEAVTGDEGGSAVDDYTYINGLNDCRSLLMPLEFGDDFEGDPQMEILGNCPNAAQYESGTISEAMSMMQTVTRAASVVLALFAAVMVVRNAADKGLDT